MSSIQTVDIVKELEEENKILSNELVSMRKKMEILIEFKITFDLYLNKIKQSLELNEWQKFETLLTKINEFVDTREMSKNNVDVDNGQTQPQQLQKVSQLSIGTIKMSIILNVF